LHSGVELVTDPSVLFLDEPTTGLDSHTALGMVHTLKALAKTGRTIVRGIAEKGLKTREERRERKRKREEVRRRRR
jgi:ABC-type cobalamin/Fe3+-siderophores transport system ATPase subunit